MKNRGQFIINPLASMTNLCRFVNVALALTTNLCRFVNVALALTTNLRRFVNDPVGLNTKQGHFITGHGVGTIKGRGFNIKQITCFVTSWPKLELLHRRRIFCGILDTHFSNFRGQVTYPFFRKDRSDRPVEILR